MTTLTLPKETTQDTSDNELHIVDENYPDIAFCGKDVSADPWESKSVTGLYCKTCVTIEGILYESGM